MNLEESGRQKGAKKNNPSSRSRSFILQELKYITENPSESYSVGLQDSSNIYVWEVVFMCPKDTLYEGALLKGLMTFPTTYPEDPPSFRFTSEVWHPNIDQKGNVCISILHNPGEDIYEYEDVTERWMPVRDINSVLLSITILLNYPNPDSPANLEAAQEYMNDAASYKKRVRRLVEKTLL